MERLSLGGYAGKVLRVDLTKEQIKEEALDEVTLRKWVGGTSLGSKFLYDLVSPGVEPFDPGNVLIFATGPLAGTRVPGSGTFCVVTKGPLTNGAAATQANGFLGAFLKFSGYDAIIIEGCLRRWKYLLISDGSAKLVDAEHLRGRDTREMEEAIKADIGAPVSVYGIGPAGENLVRFAMICGDRGHVAAHNGVGAVMGSKKLKAIAVSRGKLAVPVRDRTQLDKHRKRLLQAIDNDFVGQLVRQWGTLEYMGLTKDVGQLPVKNYSAHNYAITKEDLEKFGGPYIRGRFRPKPHPCWACPMHHCHSLTITEGSHAGLDIEEPDYECLAAFGPQIGQTDATAAMILCDLNDRLGMDCNEAGWVIGLVMECYERGIITKKDTDGLEMSWGNAEAVATLLRKIANREGFGAILAQGVMKAAQAIGGEAPNLAVHTMKGNTPRGHDHRADWSELFDTCVSSTGTLETGRVVFPEKLRLPPYTRSFSPEEVSSVCAKAKGAMLFEDSVGTCRFVTMTNIELLCEMLNAITGWDFTFEEAMQVGRRAANLLRCFNIRHGHTADLDAPSPRYGSTPAEGPAKGVGIRPAWDNMLRNYYREMGWQEETGKPLPTTLKSLGLGDVVPELWG